MSEARSTDRHPEVTYRRATEADLTRVFAVFRAALNAYLLPAGQPGIPEQDQQSPGYRHFLQHDGERFWVAEAVVEELTAGAPGTLDAGGRQIVGWGSGLLRGDWWFLSGLFVLPEAQGRGVGTHLFELAGSGAPPGAVHAAVTDSLQPASNNLYARRGLLPREILIGFEGVPDAPDRSRGTGTLVPERLTMASVPELVEVDAAVTGVERAVDHAFYLTEGGRHGFLFRRRGRPAAYVVLRDDGWVGPVAAVGARDLQTVTAFGIADLAWRGVTEKVSGGVTARAERAQRAFWESGLRFSGTPALLLASRPWGRLDRYAPGSYGFF